MSSKEIGIEEARKTLGHLALEVQRTGQPIILTRGNSRTPVARIAPLEETVTTTYTAAITTNPADVAGHYCDVCVVENTIAGYQVDADGNETPDYVMGDNFVMEAIDTNVRVDDDDALEKAQKAAEEILKNQGWTIVGDWEVSDNAMYAQVERDA